MGFMTAALTEKHGLRLAILGIHHFANRTDLRDGGRVHQEQHATGPLELITEHVFEHARSLIEDEFVQLRFLRDVASRTFDGSRCGYRHVPQFQVFQQVVYQLMCKVLAT